MPKRAEIDVGACPASFRRTDRDGTHHVKKWCCRVRCAARERASSRLAATLAQGTPPAGQNKISLGHVSKLDRFYAGVGHVPQGVCGCALGLRP